MHTYTYDIHINIAVSQGLGTLESGGFFFIQKKWPFPKFFRWVPKLEIVHEQLAAIDPPGCLLQGVFWMLILLMLFTVCLSYLWCQVTTNLNDTS